ncbi:hypothetical protein SSX86_006278 [Deinandra increscens subsp. villosa]|uniref:Trichome birefringence-like N-terminal domain-containing protein n=1 Tax=Deinandra increscens subsp. villosa TaxID=3103831 RepID=A0AAP0DEY7_9ASTR
MKGGGGYFYEWRLKQLSLLFFFVVSTTFVVWSWGKNPLFNTIFPSHGQVLQLFPGGEVKVKEVTQSKDDLREAQRFVNVSPPEISINTPSLNTQEDEGAVNLASPLVSINTPSLKTRGGEGVVNLASPLNSITTPSLDIQGDNKDSSTALEKHLGNTTEIVEKSVSSEGSERYIDSKPPKQQLVEPTSPKKQDSDVQEKACNFGKGKWVRDADRPLYSGFGCKQWLSPMWACRLTQRTDFAYEKLRWQPKECQMDSFSGPEFLKRMQDKTLAFIGDSLGRQQFQSLM